MKKSDWIYLASIMWQFSESNGGRISPLLKELIQAVNNNMEMIIDELEQNE
tara:strand:- start:1450 stop:1602 length:153 start_codon:yes stop_codon:yes gene_type:complete